MRRTALRSAMAILGVCLSADALTGNGDSATGPFTTVAPMLDWIVAPTEASIEATFSEPMLAPASTTAENYAVSCLGTGTLAATPDGVSGSGAYTLTWSTRKMQDGQTVTLSASGLQEAARICKVDAGRLAKGGVADTAILDANATWTLDAKTFVSRSPNSSFIRGEVTGQVKWTVCGGKLVFG